MAAMVSSPFASQSLKHLIVMLNSYPVVLKTKIHLRHILLQNIDIVDVAMTTHGSSFLQFLVLDSYRFDGTNHEVPTPTGVDVDTWTIKQSEEWSTHGGSTEYQLLENSVTSDLSQFGTLARNQAASHLLEVLLQVAPLSAYNRMIETRFKGKLLELIRHPVANFVVQKLIKYTRTETQFKQIYDEIKANMAEFYAGRSGVVVSLTQACLRLPNMQPLLLADIIQSISNISSKSPEELKTKGFAKLVLTLSNAPKHVFKKKKTLDRNRNRKGESDEGATNEEKLEFSAIGCQLMSTLFKFAPSEVNWILNDFCEMSTPDVLDMALDRNASRTFESFLLSPVVALQTKQSLGERLSSDEKFIQRLSTDKSGSHVLDQIFAASSAETKAKIVESILPIEKQLLSLHHGKFVLNNMRISEYRRNKDAWMKAEASKLVRKKAFDEILSFAADASRSTPGASSSDKSKSKDIKKKKDGEKKSETHARKGTEKEEGKFEGRREISKPKTSQDAKQLLKHGENTKHFDGKKDKKNDDNGKKREGDGKRAQGEKNENSGAKSTKMEISGEGEGKAASNKKRKREEEKDDIDDIFGALDEKEPTAKKPKSIGDGQKQQKPKKSTAPAPIAPIAAPSAPLSKLKQKKLAKAEKATQRAAQSAS